MKFLIFITLATACGAFEKPNKISPAKDFSELKERDALYCKLSKPIYDKQKTIEPNCDAAIFTSLHGLQCGYVDPSVFESRTQRGKLCRRPGCTCFDNKIAGKPFSKAGFSKDQATGLQLYYANKPDKPLAVRVQKYGISKKWFVCEAEDAITLASQCLMSLKIQYRWAEIERKGSELELEGLKNQPEDDETSLTGNVDFKAHIEQIGVMTEETLYKGISDASLKKVKAQAAREPNNLIFQAMLAKFVLGNEEEVKNKLLAKFPKDRLPNTSDWCTPYLYQRDEFLAGIKNKDWLPCLEENETHPGTEYLVASWILQR